MANIAQSVNVLSPLLTTPTTLTKQTIYYPLYLFSKYMRGHALAVHVRCPEYKGDMAKAVSADGSDFGWLNGTVDLPLLDVSAAIGPAVKGDEEGQGMYVSLAIVNASEDEHFMPDFDIAGGLEWRKVRVFTVTGHGVGAMNTERKSEVGIREVVQPGIEGYALPKLSLTLFRWKA